MTTATNNRSANVTGRWRGSWIPRGIRSGMPAASASPEVVAILHKSDAGEKEKERQKRLPPARFSTSSCTSWSLTRSHPPMTRQRGSRTARDEAVLKLPDGCAMNLFFSCTIPLFPRFPARSAARCFFSSALRGGVMCRRRDDHDGESQLREKRALPSMRSTLWLSRLESDNSQGSFCFSRRGIYRFFVPTGVYSAMEFFESQRDQPSLRYITTVS